MKGNPVTVSHLNLQQVGRSLSQRPDTVPRPHPPAFLFDVAGLLETHRAFLSTGLTVPAPDLEEWIRTTFIAEGAPLENPHHAHLQQASIGCLWATSPNKRHMQRVVGQAEIPAFRGNAWSKSRQEQQIIEWFGAVPDFVLTFDAAHAAEVDDATFCALIEHELCHCAPVLDEFGAPKFGQDGRPKFGIRGHDVEEFVTVVERYGASAAAGRTLDLVAAAQRGPTIAPALIAHTCGTCGRRAA